MLRRDGWPDPRKYLLEAEDAKYLRVAVTGAHSNVAGRLLWLDFHWGGACGGGMRHGEDSPHGCYAHEIDRRATAMACSQPPIALALDTSLN